VPQLDNYIYPGYSVYPPTRQEYLDLLPRVHNENKDTVIMDVGTGTGILTAILLHQNPNISTAFSTDINPLAIQCARDNMQRLGLAQRVRLNETSLFAPDAVADVLVCNPPWIPCHGSVTNSWLDRAIYDDNLGSMLYGFLDGAASRLRDERSEAWLILSDLAEHLQLRSREELLQRIHDGGLEIVETRAAVKEISTIKQCKKKEEPLAKVAAARNAETTHLYRLRKRQP